jgi:signal transduction histidine kinase
VLRTRPLSTTTFRLTLAYLGLFSLSALTLLAVVYMVSMRFIDRQTREPIDDELTWMLETYERGGLEVLKTIVDERAAAEPNRRAMYLLVDSRGRFLAGNLDRVPPDMESNGAFSRFEVQVTEDGRRLPKAHVATAKTVTLDDGARLLVGRDVHDGVQIQRLMRMAILIGAGVMVVLGLGGGLIMSRWMLSRLERINRATAQIMTGDLAQRIRTEGAGDEFDELAQNLNAMLDRIERLLVGMRQVTDDIAHDLRTPLTRLRSRIEVGLMHELDHAEARELLEATIRDADNLIETFNALLSIARAEAGGQRGEWEPIDLSELTHEVFELYEPLAEDKGAKLTLQTGTGVTTLGNRQLVAQAIANLADNAVKYAPEGGHVWLRTTAYPAPRIEVADDGPGIPEDQRERAKQRFVRLDATRTTPGSGLGLSLVDAVAKLHDARLELLDNQPGLKVWLTFHPLPPPERTTRTPGERAPAYASGSVGGDRGSA